MMGGISARPDLSRAGGDGPCYREAEVGTKGMDAEAASEVGDLKSIRRRTRIHTNKTRMRMPWGEEGE